jgi:hypothetical protein
MARRSLIGPILGGAGSLSEPERIVFRERTTNKDERGRQRERPVNPGSSILEVKGQIFRAGMRHITANDAAHPIMTVGCLTGSANYMHSAYGGGHYFGNGVVQCSCATASVHEVPGGRSVIQVSTSLPPSML